MNQATAIPVRNINNKVSTYSKPEDQFSELIAEINYGIKKMKAGKWNLADYWYHMADFFDYIGLPADAEEHRDMARKWLAENSAL